MTVEKLIALLSKMTPTATVQAWDADSDEYEKVSGVVWDDEGVCVYIQTDAD